VKVLITGASGCVGANIAKAAINAGLDARVLVRARSKRAAFEDLSVSPVQGDLLDVESLKRAVDGCAWVFHAAGLVSFWQQNWRQAMEVNVRGTENMIAAYRSVGIERFIFTSSMSAVGHADDPADPVDETAPFNYAGMGFVYHRTKWEAEQAVLAAVHLGLPAVVLNPGLVFGERDINLSSGAMFQAVRSAPFPFPVVQGGQAVCDGDDVGEAHVNAAQWGRIGERYILVSENLTNMELMTLVARVTGQKPPRRTLPRFTVKILSMALHLLERFAREEWTVTGDILAAALLYNYGDASKAVRELSYRQTPALVSMEKSYKWLLSQGIL